MFSIKCLPASRTFHSDRHLISLYLAFIGLLETPPRTICNEGKEGRFKSIERKEMKTNT
jgi:hypothetical protein